MCVEDGLDNIEIGVMSALPTEGSAVTADSYTVCGRHSGSVATTEKITVDCVATVRYLVIRSLDTTPEQLCMAEVVVHPRGLHPCTQPRKYWRFAV